VPREGDFTSDEPYIPGFVPEEAEEILALTGVKPGKSIAERASERPEKPRVQVHKGASQLDEDQEFRRKVKEIQDKLDKGERLSEADAAYLHDRAITRIITSRRPSMVARGVQFIQNAQIKKLLEQGRVPGAPAPAAPDPAAGLGLSSWKG
jgi:hypothetical protein